MAATTGRALLLTCLWYIREVDPATLLLTGLTRDGVYLVEDGQVVGEVNNFRFNESPVDLLSRASEAGRTEKTLPREWGDWFTRAAMPALRIPDFNMSSVSQGCDPPRLTRTSLRNARSTGTVTDIVDELKWRGLFAQSTDEDALRKALADGPVTFYCGFDPTAASLHVGHLVQVLTVQPAPAGGSPPARPGRRGHRSDR